MPIWPELSNRFCQVSFWPIHHLEYSVKLFLHFASMYIIWMIWNTKPCPTKTVVGNLNFWLLCFFLIKINSCFWSLKQKPEVSLGFPLLSLTRPLWWRYPCDRYIFAVWPWSESMCEETLTRGDVEQLVEKWVKHRWNWRTTVSFWWLYGYSMIHTRKLTWQWKKQAFEDVSPTKHGDVPLSC